LDGGESEIRLNFVEMARKVRDVIGRVIRELGIAEYFDEKGGSVECVRNNVGDGVVRDNVNAIVRCHADRWC
jgi:hypothetical protein